MPASYLPYEPDQDLLLPPSLSEWLPQGQLTYFISDTVDALDLSAFHARYEAGGPGNQPFHPAMMVNVLLYAYARVLAAENQPASRTLRNFRAFDLKAVQHARAAPRHPGAETGLRSAQSAQDVCLAGLLRGKCEPARPSRTGMGVAHAAK